MKTLFLKLLAITLLITFTSCKKEQTIILSEYKYEEKGIVLNCDKMDLKLLNEALFSFENDILNAFAQDKKNLAQAYAQFTRSAVSGRANYEEIVSLHSLAVFEVLKSKQELWDLNNPNTKLNYNSSLFQCIVENIKSKDLKTTLHALISTNSMSTKLFGSALNSEYRSAVSDKYLSAYMAFDLFYAKLYDIDINKVIDKEKKVDFNKLPPTPTTPAVDTHAGHNH